MLSAVDALSPRLRMRANARAEASLHVPLLAAIREHASSMHLNALIKRFNVQYFCVCWCCIPKSQDKDSQPLCQPALRRRLDGWWDLKHNPSYLGVHAKAGIKPCLDIGHI